MSAIFQNENVLKSLRMTVTVVKSVWEWTRDRLWPIYSAAIVLSVFEMIAASSEKQIIADSYYGGAASSDENKVLGTDRTELIADSKKHFSEEVSLSIKEHVWQLPGNVFKGVYTSRLGAE